MNHHMRAFVFSATPIGDVTLAECDGALVSLHFGRCAPPGAVARETPLLRAAAAQLGEYFALERETFDLPLRIEGTDFQKRVWRALSATCAHSLPMLCKSLSSSPGRPTMK